MSIAADLLVKLGADPSGLVAGMKTAETAVKATKLSLGDLQALLKQLQNERPQIVDDAQLKQYNATISALKTNIKELQSVGVAGFDELGRKISSTSGPINEAYSGVRKLAQILPGIGIGGLFALAFEGLGAAISSFASSANEAESIQRKLNEALGAGSASVQGEVHAMTDLAAIALDVTNSTDERKKAFTELQSLYPGYLGNLKFEKTSYEDLQIALDKVTAALVRQAEIKGLEGAISDTFKELNKTIADGGTGFQQFSSGLAGVFGALSDTTANFKGITGLTNNLIDAFHRAKDATTGRLLAIDTQDAQKQVEALNAKLKELLGDSLKNNDALLNQKVPPAPPVVDFLQKEIDALENLEKLKVGEIKLPPLAEAFAKSIDPDAENLLSDKIALLIRNNTRDGVKKSITDQEVALMQQQLNRLVNPNLKSRIDLGVTVNPKVEDQVNTFESTIAPQLTDLTKKLPPIKTDIKVDPALIFDKDFGTKAGFEKFASTIEEGYVSAISSAINSGSEAIGKLIATGDSKSFLNVLGQILATALKAIGQAYVTAATAVIVAKKAFQAFLVSNPELALIAGIGLEIAGSALLASVSKTKAFATGGIVTGPTNALIGEAGPEVVFPLDRLNQFIKGGTGNNRVEVVGQTIISGPNLITVLKRAQTNQGMV